MPTDVPSSTSNVSPTSDASPSKAAATTGVRNSSTSGATTASASDMPVTASAERYLQVQRSAEFAGLRRSLRNFVFPMTAAFFLWYALYVLLSAYARDFMGIKIIGNINVALVLGLLQFVSTFLIAWYYARYAEKHLDPVADKIHADLDGENK